MHESTGATMTDQQASATPPPGGASERRRAAPTIDLEATEVGGSARPAGPAGPAPKGRAQVLRGVLRGVLQQSALAMIVAAVGGAALAGAAFLAGSWLAGGHDPALDARLAQLELRVGEVANRPAPPPPPQVAPAAAQKVDDLAARLDKLDQTLAQVQDRAPALAGRVATAEAQVKSLSDKVAALDARATPADQQSAAQGAPASEPDPQTASLIAALTARVAALESNARDIEKTIEGELATPPRTSSDDRSARAAVVAVALADAIVRGRPMVAELAAAKVLAPDPSVLAPLDGFAAAGVPTGPALGRELSALEPTLLQAAAPPPSDRSVLERLEDNARGLVRIRPIGEVAGDEPEAIIARAEFKSARGDLAGALAELSALPAGARAPAQGWISKAQGRVAAIEAGRRFVSDTLAALGQPKP
jgi:hypothetical protein